MRSPGADFAMQQEEGQGCRAAEDERGQPWEVEAACLAQKW